jgi:hypothetical protein
MNARRTIVVAAALLSLIVAPLAAAKDRALDADVITCEMAAHPFVWARPLHGGPIRVLFIAPRFTLRDVVELAERFDLDYETAALDTATAPLSGPLQDRLGALLDKSFDVIVAANFNFDLLPETLQSRIIDRVANGAGLLLAQMRPNDAPRFKVFLEALDGVDEQAAITRGVGDLAGAAKAIAPTTVVTSEHGKGRVVQLIPSGEAPRTQALIGCPPAALGAFRGYQDNAYALVARALCWVARRDSKVHIAAIQNVSPEGPSPEEIPPDLPTVAMHAKQPTHPYRLFLDAPADRAYTVSIQVRKPDADTRQMYECKSHMGKGSQSYPLDLVIGPGETTVDVWLHDKKGVVDWFTRTLSVEDWPMFSEVQYAKNFLLPHDVLDITVAAPPQFNQNSACTIYARATDPLPRAGVAGGRVVAEAMHPMTSEGGRATLRLEFADLIAPIVKVEVFAVEGDPRVFGEWELSTADRDYRYFTVRHARRPLDTELAFAAPRLDEYNARRYAEVLAGAGADAIFGAGGEANLFHAALTGLHYLPDVGPTAQSRNAADPAKLDEPDARKRETARVQADTLVYWAGGAGRYTLGAPARPAYTAPPEGDFKAFRAAMQAQYKQLAVLNSSWNTQFEVWEDVRPLDAVTARGAHSFGAFADFCAYRERALLEYTAAERDAVRAADHDAKAGVLLRHAPPEAPCAWGDWAARVDFLVAPDDALSLARLCSWRQADGYAAALLTDIDAASKPDAIRHKVWDVALHQIHGLWCDAPYGDAEQAAQKALLYPDARVTPALKALTDAVAPLRAGLGALFAAAERDGVTVAIYDSAAGDAVAAVENVFPAAREAALRAWVRILDRAGIAYEFVDGARLRGPRMKGDHVLILPMARALSASDIDAIQAFAKAGGALLADAAPGLYDEHGSERAANPLDTLFGIRRAGAPQALRAAGVALEWKTAKSTLRAQLVNALPDASIQADAAHALGRFQQTPIWLMNGPNSAGSLLLNHPFTPEQAAESDVEELAAAWLAQAGAAPLLAGPAGKPLDFEGKVFRFHYGTAQILALLADPGAAHAQKLKRLFPKTATVYDLCAGERVGKPWKLTAKIEPGAVACYAALPYKVKGVAVISQNTVAAGQRLPLRFSVVTDNDSPGKHLVCVDLVPKKRPPLKHYRQLLTCENGVGDTYIPLARNETPGSYHLEVRDVLSGVRTAIPVTVLNARP